MRSISSSGGGGGTLKNEVFHCEGELPVLDVWFIYGLEDKVLPFIAKAPAF